MNQPLTVKDKGVSIIYQGDEVAGFFTRDEKSNENIIFICEKASLDDIKNLFTNLGKL